MTKEFYVHTENLKKVAGQIQSLLDAITSDDNSPGTYGQFQKIGSIDGPTKTFWDGPNALADAYTTEHRYVCDTYDALIHQLNNVMAACNDTAAKYEQHEKNAETGITSGGTEFTS